MHRIRDREGRERDTVNVKGGVIKGLDWRGGRHIFCRSRVVELPAGVEMWEGEPDEK
jgi:hypothetical protein